MKRHTQHVQRISKMRPKDASAACDNYSDGKDRKKCVKGKIDAPAESVE